MKSTPATLQCALLLALVTVGASPVFGQSTRPLPPLASGIDPATGLPRGRTGPTTGLPGTINPLTGLPNVSANPRSVLPDTTSTDPLVRAREAMDQGRFEEALQGFLAHYETTHLTLTNGPLVLVLSDWVELGQRYPKARRALLGIRDKDTQQFVEGEGTDTVFKELVDINAALGEPDATYALFLGLEQADPPLAAACSWWIEPLLVERGEYATCGRYLSDPEGRFRIYRNSFQMTQGMAQDQAEREQERLQYFQEHARTNRFFQDLAQTNSSEIIRQFAERSRTNPPIPITLTRYKGSDSLKKNSTDGFVRSVSQLLEILVGIGRQAEAEKIRAQALEVLDDPRLRPTISDIEAKVRTVQASRCSPPAPLVIHPQFPERSTLFLAEWPEPSASVEHYVPGFKRGDKVDVHLVLEEARDLEKYKHYEEALQRYLWYYNHALEYDPNGQRGVRSSFALSYWVKVARDYPKAREAMLEVRDRKLQPFATGQGTVALFNDIVDLDEAMGHDRTTCRLFKHLHEHQPELAKRCYAAAEDALVKQREYALCLAYVGDGQARFKQYCKSWERMTLSDKHTQEIQQRIEQGRNAYYAQQGGGPPAGLPRMEYPLVADKFLVRDTRKLIELLVGGGHKADAENICTQALALVDDPQIRSAVADAEQKCGQ